MTSGDGRCGGCYRNSYIMIKAYKLKHLYCYDLKETLRFYFHAYSKDVDYFSRYNSPNVKVQ